MVKRLLISLAVASAGFGGAAQAADLAPLYGQVEEPDALPPQQFTFGTGWYLRGDIGWSNAGQLQIGSNFPDTQIKNKWDGDIGVGYRWNEWFRSDLTIGGHEGLHIDSTGGRVICPYQLHGLQTQDATPKELGYLWSSQSGTCTGKASGYEDQLDLLANGYFDLGTWYGFTPYIGGGLGVARIKSSDTVNYFRTSDGGAYDANLTPTGTYPMVWVNQYGGTLAPQPTIPDTNTPVSFSQQNWKRSYHRMKYNFAWALMGGVSYAIDSNLSLDLGYRYLNAGTYTTIVDSQGGTASKKPLTSQAVRLGVRYMLN